MSNPFCQIAKYGEWPDPLPQRQRQREAIANAIARHDDAMMRLRSQLDLPLDYPLQGTYLVDQLRHSIDALLECYVFVRIGMDLENAAIDAERAAIRRDGHVIQPPTAQAGEKAGEA